MNREIKFRAWIENDPNFGNHMRFWDVTERFNDNDYYHCLSSKHPLMQFTGLKDKNGREIYEGDILKVRPYYYQENFVEEVKFRKGYFYCQYFLGEIANEAEILGNIYENPELLSTNE